MAFFGDSHISLREANEREHKTRLQGRMSMLSDKQRQKALKINIEHAHNMARDLRAEDVDDVTLTYYADERSFRTMKLAEQGDDFEFAQLVIAETAKVMLEYGLHLTLQ